MSLPLDLNPAHLGLTNGEPWSGDATWTDLGWGGLVEGVTVDGHRGLRFAFTDAPGAIEAVTPSEESWAFHLVARITSPPTSEAPGVIGGPSLRVTPGRQWVRDISGTGPLTGAHLITVTSGDSPALYVDGALVAEDDPRLLTSSLIVGAYGPGLVLDVLRLQLVEGVPVDLADDMAALVAQYGIDPGLDPGLEATGVWGITGDAAFADVDPWQEPPIPAPESGGSVTPPAPPEAQLPPVGVPDPVIRLVSEDMPRPTLGEHGRPVDWEQGFVESRDWGRLQVVVEGQDITYLDGVPTPFPTVTEVEPFGWASASIRLPQLTTFHALGKSALSWCRQGANVRIRVKKIGGGYVDLFRGFVESPATAEPGGGVTLECTGLLFQADKSIRPPAFTTRSRDAGRVIASLLNGVPGRRYRAMEPAATGCRTSVAGSWEPLLTGAVQQLLTSMVDAFGQQWTLMPEGREPVLSVKDTTTVSWSVRAGQRGIHVDLERELLPNAVYGEGVRPDGGRWRNAKYPNWRPDDTPPFPMSPSSYFRVGTRDADTSSGSGVSDWQEKVGQPETGVYSSADAQACRDLQREAGIQVDGTVGPQTWAAAFGTGSNTGTLDGAFIAPLVAAPAVVPRLHGPDGDDLGPNPEYAPDIIRVEDMIAFGQGVTKAEARSWARRIMARSTPNGYSAHAYHGTVRFELDPGEGHRLEVVRAGTNGVIRGVHGEPLIVHVAHVTMQQASSGGIVVTATVDTEARDYPTLSAIRTRERNAVDPAKAFIKRRGRADELSDRATFDAESPAGRVPRHALFRNLWTVIRVPFGDYGTVVRTEFRTSDNAAPFALAVFSKPITASELLSVVGNPLTAESNPWSEHADTLEARGLLMAWGWAKQPAGYYPRSYSTPDGEESVPVTGKLLDDATWRYASEQSPWLWVAEIASAGCFIEGRFWPGVD